jgi:scaffold protein (connect acetoacetyl-CoA thiolase and HMG-CoA synthase)
MDTARRARPIRTGLFQIDPPRLLGSACQNCGIRSFPARDFCPACLSDDVEANVPLSPSGTLYSFTTVRQAPPGRKTPYNLGYIDLDDGVRLLAQIDITHDELEIGMPLQVNLRPVGMQEDEDLIGYVFVRGEARERSVR